MDILLALAKGIAYGITLALLIGPVFFALIQVSITNGFRAGLYMAFGIAVSDLACVLLTWFGLAPFASDSGFQRGLGIGGGILLLVFGVITLFKKGIRPALKGELVPKAGKLTLFVKGFALNAVNPFTLFFWLSTSGMVLRENYTGQGNLMFYAGTLITVLCTDAGKSYAARLLSKLATPVLLTRLNRVAGVLLLLFGLRMLYTSLLKGL